jgi:hypothetical protein
MIDANGIPEAAPGLIWRALDDGVVLVSPDAGNVRVLNRIGGALWKLIDGRNSIADMQHYLVTQYDVSPEQAGGDVRHFLTELAERDLISWVDEEDEGR